MKSVWLECWGIYTGQPQKKTEEALLGAHIGWGAWGIGPSPSSILASSAEACIFLSWISTFPVILNFDLAPAGQNLSPMDARAKEKAATFREEPEAPRDG